MEIDYIQLGNHILEGLQESENIGTKPNQRVDRLRRQGRWSEALELCKQNLDRIRGEHAPGAEKDYAEGVALLHRSMVYLGRERQFPRSWKEALKDLNKAAICFHGNDGQKRSEGIVWMAIGVVWETQGRERWDEAVKSYGRAADILEAVDPTLAEEASARREDILHGVGEPTIKETREESSLSEVPETRVVAIVDEISAGPLLLVEGNIKYYLELDARIIKDADFGQRVKGQSMVGARIQEGDYVFVRQQHTADNEDTVVVQVRDEETEEWGPATLKKYYYDYDRQIFRFISLPRSGERRDVRLRKDKVEGKIRIVGKVVGIWHASE